MKVKAHDFNRLLGKQDGYAQKPFNVQGSPAVVPARCPVGGASMLVWIFERQHFEVWPEGRRPQKPEVVEKRELSRDAKENDQVDSSSAR